MSKGSELGEPMNTDDNNTKPAKDARDGASPVESALIAGLTHLRDTLKRGERLEKRYTMRTVDLNLEPQDYDAEHVRKTRELLRASQAVFAKLLGVKAKTIQSWEQGVVPPAMARRLLDLVNDNPQQWLDILQRAAEEKTTQESQT